MVELRAVLLGIVFGLGLILAGISDPAKVLAFLDIAGLWDPSLGLVMVGAVGVALPAFQWAIRRGRLAGERFRIDAPLLLGSLLFGVGWGLSGFCPGLALVGVGAGYLPAIVFAINLLFGMEAYDWMSEALARRKLRRAAE
jgi:uncharacterized membrane protein YedE/YeeE